MAFNFFANKLRADLEKYKESRKSRGAFSLFHSKIVSDYLDKCDTYGKLKGAIKLVDSWEKSNNIPYNVGISLEALINREDLVVCIHRTNKGLNRDVSGLPDSEELRRIMQVGLENYGHINAGGGSAFHEGYPDLTNTTSSISNLGGYINLVGSLKNNDTTIILAFPSSLVDKSGNIIDRSKCNMIYNVENGISVIKPEYIVGALLKKTNGFDEFYTKGEILESSKKTM